ncbi:MAG: hypothetical protein IKK53_07470 [Ruminiclostridium sp.]|nr:hypothetical protein [Ruminiclostridium sp.]
MSMEAMDKFEMIIAIGTVIICVLFYVVLAIVCFVISSKKKKTNPADSKTWKTLGTILVVVGIFALVGVGAAVIIPMLLSQSVM